MCARKNFEKIGGGGSWEQGYLIEVGWLPLGIIEDKFLNVIYLYIVTVTCKLYIKLLHF